MSLTVAILIYLGLVGLVSTIMIYYFKVMRPKEEQQYERRFDP